MLAYHTDAMVNDHIRSDYTITYRTFTNGVVQASSTGHMTVLSGQLSGKRGSDATSTNVYDANGYLVGVDYTTAGDAPKSGTSKKIFIVDAHGNILLSREQSWNSPTVEQRQILIGDELELRYSINYGTFGDLQAEQRNAFWDAYNADAYQSLVTPGGTITAEAGNNPTTGEAIVVAEGDTLQSIAQRVYGTADAWYRIADANNLEHDSVLVAGTTLVAPAATADTNKLDFNMGKLVGSTAPNLPPPPPDNKNCITLIIVAVAVVVGCVVAPYMTGFVAGMGLTGAAATAVAGGLTAAAANVASQAVGIVGGVQDGMNWSGVARSAVGGALNAGLDAVVGNGAGLTSSSFVNAGLSNIASQAVMIATHRQEKFSWSSVVGAAVSGAVVRSDAMRDMQTSMAGNGWSGWAQGAVNGGLGAVFGGVATKFSWASVAGAVVAGGVANSDTMMGIGNSMANAGWSPFAQGFVASGVSGFAGNLTKDLVARGKQDWAQIGIATFEGALSTGLEVQRQFNLARGTPFLFDDVLTAAGRRAGEAVGDVFGNAVGSSLVPIGASAGTDSSQFSNARRTASLTDTDFADNEYGNLRARLMEYGPDARADFATDDELKVLERAAADNGGVLPRNGDFAPTPDITADDLTMQRVVITGKRPNPQPQPDSGMPSEQLRTQLDRLVADQFRRNNASLNQNLQALTRTLQGVTPTRARKSATTFAINRSPIPGVAPISSAEFIDRNGLSQERITAIMNDRNPKLVDLGVDKFVYDVSQGKGLNPKVLLATLAQEQNWGKNGKLSKLAGIDGGGGGNPVDLPIGKSIERAAEVYRNNFDVANNVPDGTVKIRINYDPKDNEQRAVFGASLADWQAKNPDDVANLHKGYVYVPAAPSEYAKLRYTPFTYFAPQQSRPYDTWVNLFRSFK